MSERRGVGLSVVLAMLAWGSSVLAYEGKAVEGGGTVTGAARFLGHAPAPKKLEITKDHAVCAKVPKYSEVLIVGPGKGLHNAVVFLDRVKSGKPLRAGRASIDNRECRYEPHVQAVAVGTEMLVKNSDAVLHNTHAKLPNSDVFNYGLPEKGQVIPKKLTRTGLIKVGCDAGHTWMSAYILVFDHPYFAVTDTYGRFTIGDVPPGKYNLIIWHEKLGKQVKPVTVTPGGKVELSVEWK